MVKVILRISSQYMENPITRINDEKGCFDYVETGELNISDELKRDIKDWDEEFQATLAPYPPDSAFPSEEAEQKHIDRERKLKQRLQEELGNGYSVIDGTEWRRNYKKG